MGFVGGVEQAGFVRSMERAGPARTVLAGIDVGKFEALALIADGRGELLAEPCLFRLDEPGVRSFEGVVDGACAARSATLVRLGVEACGHYHRLLVHRLRAAGWDTVDLSPAQVHAARSQMGYRRLKTDQRDAAAMIEVLIRGGGRADTGSHEAMAQLQAWVAHRHRKQAARVALGNQLLASIDLAFPSLQGCFTDPLARKSFWLVLKALDADIDQVTELTPAMLRVLGAEHQVKVEMPKAVSIITSAHQTLRLAEPERQARLEIVRRDAAMLEALLVELDNTDQRVAGLLEQTPARVLTSLPGVGSIRAADYAAALGDHTRFPSAEHAYRASGLVPSQYDSAGSNRHGGIGREGSATLRHAIIEMGRGLAQHDEYFAAYRRALLARGKRPKVANVAIGHRAHRLAFALISSQQTYDPGRFAAAIATQGERRKTADRPVNGRRAARSANDVTCPPTPTVTPTAARRNTPVAS
jgi:transposase